MTARSGLGLWVWVLLLIGCAPEQSVKPGINDEFKKPDLSVETWVGRFEIESREIFAHREAIADATAVRSGQVVADIGAGTGFLTQVFADRVGPSGKVYAVDIAPAFLELIRNRAKADGLANIKTVLCSERSIELPADSIDAAFVCDTYHHFEYPRSTLRSIRRAMRPGGALVIVDFERIEGTSRAWVLEHVRCGREQVIREIEQAGFELVPETPKIAGLKENYLIRFLRK